MEILGSIYLWPRDLKELKDLLRIMGNNTLKKKQVLRDPKT